MEVKNKAWTIFAILVAYVSIWFQLDATPALTLADLYLRHINPSLLPKTFHADTVTLITGASSGFGAEMTKQLCTKTSTNLILMARRMEKLQELQKHCSENSDKVSIALVEGDVKDGAEAQTKWIKTALNELGKKEVDIAIVNAGRGYLSAVSDTQEDIIRDIMELNYMGAVSTVKAVLSTYSDYSRPKQMIAVSSVAAKLPVALAAGYSASKAAMNSFFDSLRAERSGMRVTTVCPGPFHSDIQENSRRENAAFGGKGPVPDVKAENRMDVDRAVELTLAGSVVHPSWLFHELWFSPQPVLTFTALAQYFPDLVKFVGRPVGGCGGSVVCEAAKKNI